ncbi:MAG: hypothetical protein P4L80_12070 [Xanthobacteraceae bacterium]|nr:hypothetical protein [Xanthobacteraceae bacterium]
MAAHSRGPDDGAGLDPVDHLTGPLVFHEWLRAQTVEDVAPNLLLEIERSRLIRIAEQRHETLWTAIQREHADDIAALVHVGLIDEPTLKPKRRKRRATKEHLQ